METETIRDQVLRDVWRRAYQSGVRDGFQKGVEHAERRVRLVTTGGVAAVEGELRELRRFAE